MEKTRTPVSQTVQQNSTSAKDAMNQNLATVQDTGASVKSVAAQIYSGYPLPAEFQSDDERNGGKVIYTGHRGDVVDLVTVHGKILYGTKLNSPEYISITYPKGHMFEVDLNGVDASKMLVVYGGTNNKFTAKPFPGAQKAEIPLSSTTPTQVAALDSMKKMPARHVNDPDGDNWLEELWGDAKQAYGTGTFSCPCATDDVPFKDVLKRLKEPQPGVLRLVPTVSSSNSEDKQSHRVDSSACVIIDQSQTQIKSPDGASIAVQGKTVYQFGQRYYGSAEEIRPQQMTGFTASRHPTEDLVPKSNVFMPILDLIPKVDAIMVLAKLGKNIYKLANNWSETKKVLWDSAKKEQNTTVTSETLADRVTAEVNKDK